MSLTESPSLMIFPQEFTAMDEPIADYNRLLPVAIARAVLEAAGKGAEMAAHLSPQPFPPGRSEQRLLIRGNGSALNGSAGRRHFAAILVPFSSATVRAGYSRLSRIAWSVLGI
jgi:hypothetical protein